MEVYLTTKSPKSLTLPSEKLTKNYKKVLEDSRIRVADIVKNKNTNVTSTNKGSFVQTPVSPIWKL